MRRNPTAASSNPILAALLGLTIFSTVGCQSPPSVAPLLTAAERVINDEGRLLDDDQTRASAWLDQQRETLRLGFTTDLQANDDLDREWVIDGVTAYVAAREALLRHEMALKTQADVRRDNLRLARESIRRAIALIQHQDALFGDIPDLRRWIEGRTENASSSPFIPLPESSQ